MGQNIDARFGETGIGTCSAKIRNQIVIIIRDGQVIQFEQTIQDNYQEGQFGDGI